MLPLWRERRRSAMMIRAEDVTQFIAAPADRFLVCSSCVVWVQRHARLGVIHVTPKLDAADFATLAQCISVLTHPSLAAGYDAFLDMSCVAGVDLAAFEFITQWLDRYFSLFEPRIRKIVGIAPPGVAGAALSGLFDAWAIPRFDARLCDTRTDVYAALAIGAADRAELDALYETYGPGPLRTIRDLVAAHPHETASQLAARLAMTERSLRRLLARHGTTLRRLRPGGAGQS